MKKMLFAFGLVGCFCISSAFAVSAGTVATDSVSRGSTAYNTTSGTTNTVNRGYQGLANAYVANQRNTYYMVTQPDVDSACRTKIYNCLAEYCGDVTVVPGQRSGRCQYATESELYNYALLCLQKDTSVLLPQYNTNVRGSAGGLNTAARLCPPYVQQEVMSYLSMANMADDLSKSHSDLCLQRRQELEAAMACHSVALAYGNETTSMLTTQLTDACGAGVPGGSAEMVTRFANAGNVGANVWGWAEKILNLDMNQKGEDWQMAVDSVLASYTNRMNLACGDNLQINTASTLTSNSSQPSTLQTVAALATGVAFPTTGGANVENPYENQSLYMELTTMSEMYDYQTAYQLVQAAMSNSALAQNTFLTSAQLSNMQNAYVRGTKVFILRDSARCYIIPVQTMTTQETNLIAQMFASCISK
ncbi:MAG TPA: hypothetical protein IAC63_03260 [Candidatus Enterousia avicola]|uniref:Uncharacterized protein n=1 Tax=Candidatus Enterousia avicola TaxID=2840787 RepID=A0A9D1SN22_9PROT|nr:hypothetical protein [Candidatus Enterousia avicola]